jgi:beta-lactamase class A
MAPDGRSYAVAVMIGDTPRPIPTRQALMQAVVMAVIASHQGQAQSSLGGRSGGR